MGCEIKVQRAWQQIEKTIAKLGECRINSLIIEFTKKYPVSGSAIKKRLALLEEEGIIEINEGVVKWKAPY